MKMLIGQEVISTCDNLTTPVQTLLKFITMKKVKNWKKYCKVAYNSLRANVELWGDPDYFRPITRTFYESVFSSGYDHNGFISEDALINPEQRTQDHCLSPQFIGRMIMDNAEIYLNDYTLFENLFWIARTTIVVTKEENKKLSMLTDNRGIDYKVYVPTDQKYKHLGIKLYQRKGREWKTSVPFDNNIIPTPTDLLSYEQNFLVCQ